MHVAKTHDEAMRHLRNMVTILSSINREFGGMLENEELEQLNEAERFLKFGAMSDEVVNGSLAAEKQ